MSRGILKLENGATTLSISTLVESWKPSRPQDEENGYSYSYCLQVVNNNVSAEDDEVRKLRRYEFGLYYSFDRAIYYFLQYAMFHGYDYKSVTVDLLSALILTKYPHTLTKEEIASELKMAKRMLGVK